MRNQDLIKIVLKKYLLNPVSVLNRTRQNNEAISIFLYIRIYQKGFRLLIKIEMWEMKRLFYWKICHLFHLIVNHFNVTYVFKPYFKK